MTPIKTSRSFKAKKSFGQNFLVDQRVINKIIASCELSSEDNVLEIGPGKGALTQLLANEVIHVTAIEKDTHLASQLEEEFSDLNVTIINDDILKTSLTDFQKETKIIGNIPYNISSPIVERMIEHRKHFSSFFMTVQYEFGKRLTAKPGTKDYGSLSCFVQFYTDTKILFKIKNTCFKPIPKVQSCFLKLTFLEKPKFKVKNEEELFNFIQTAFSQRRKTILNSLGSKFDKKEIGRILELNNIKTNERAENLSLKQFVNLYNDSL